MSANQREADESNSPTGESVIPVIEFIVAADDVALVEEMLAGQGFSPAVIQPARTSAPAHFRLYPDPQKTDVAEFTRALRQYFSQWNKLLTKAVDEFSINRIKREDWAESWKLHFTPLQIGKRLLVKPSWVETSIEEGCQVVELDPGMSFGTGHHGTTRACLDLIEEITRDSAADLSFLDVGCGSGILSLAAAALGCRTVTAFDYDQRSVDVARENIKKSPFGLRIQINQDDLSTYPVFPKYRLIAANILASVVTKNARKLIDLMDIGDRPAWLILSGILEKQYCDVKDTFTTFGLKEHQSILIEGWRTGCFIAPAEI